MHLVPWLVDTNADTIPDSTDDYPSAANTDHADLDGNGHANIADAFPRDKAEWLDRDGDHLGNNTDRDDDGFPDAMDPFPLDAAKRRPPAWVCTARVRSAS